MPETSTPDNSPSSGVLLPDRAVLRRLAVNDSGFIFDPITGNSFTANQSGLAILRLLQCGDALPDLLQALTEEFEVETAVAERDLIEFSTLLRNTFK